MKPQLWDLRMNFVIRISDRARDEQNSNFFADSIELSASNRRDFSILSTAGLVKCGNRTRSHESSRRAGRQAVQAEQS